MSIWQKIGNLLGGNIIKDVGTIIDDVVTTKEERELLKQRAADAVNQRLRHFNDQITDRQRIDMSSDSWLSKNIRPLTLVFILSTYSAFSIIDGNISGFQINNNYVQLLGEWGSYIMAFYFTGRSVEKVVKLLNNKPKHPQNL